MTKEAYLRNLDKILDTINDVAIDIEDPHDDIELLPDGCLKAVKQWYIDEWIKLKEEFEKI